MVLLLILAVVLVGGIWVCGMHAAGCGLTYDECIADCKGKGYGYECVKITAAGLAGCPSDSEYECKQLSIMPGTRPAGPVGSKTDVDGGDGSGTGRGEGATPTATGGDGGGSGGSTSSGLMGICLYGPCWGEA